MLREGFMKYRYKQLHNADLRGLQPNLGYGGPVALVRVSSMVRNL